MKELTLRQLQYFVAVAEKGSISDAARALHVSPGAVSQALTDLESSLAVQLTLRRRATGVTLTRAGRLAADQARAVLAETDRLRDTAHVMRGELVGTLRIGCFPTLSPWLLPSIIEHFLREHPALRLEIAEGPSDELQRQLADGDIDACLMYSAHLRRGLDHERIAPVRLRLVLPANHRLAGRDEIALAELSAEPAVLTSLQPARDLVENLMRHVGVEPRVGWSMSNVDTIRAMVARGLGYSLLMGRPHGDLSYDGLPLIYRRIADDLPENAVVLARVRGSKPTAALAELTEFCLREFGTEGRPVQ
ncbi:MULTISPECIES: LysR substrate-binding domain-containing protein [Amycolatopsis]|uniref:LysR substrate-binding domain-containing protein n=1 Tax=Amycolatopsis TaxID=1813 RepID=UPI00068B7D2C|nr:MULTISPECIES: LysR substrate-binding domain-containing protein [Amycolatopsis]MCG3756044.1 LysR family transcriptional regulator [Amycolatopsis sp. Poz14]